MHHPGRPALTTTRSPSGRLRDHQPGGHRDRHERPVQGLRRGRSGLRLDLQRHRSPAATTSRGALSRVTGETVGTYAITQGDLALTSDYTITFEGADFAITNRLITVTATSGQSKVYGDADPVFAYTYSGTLALGDDFTGALSRATGESVGTYAITQGDLALPASYTLTFVGDDFAITNRLIHGHRHQRPVQGLRRRPIRSSPTPTAAPSPSATTSRAPSAGPPVRASAPMPSPRATSP